MSRVLVTGAGGAIGSAIVRQLSSAGATTIAHDLDDRALDAVRDLATECVAGDLADPGHRAALEARLEGLELDGAVAAHGIDGGGAFATMDGQRMRAILRINAATVPWLFAALRPALARAGGVYVAVSSQAALRGEPDNAVYSAAKHAVTGWVEAIAPDALGDGVFVRALCPGRTESPLLWRATESFAREAGVTLDEYVAETLEQIPLRRYATAEETAAAAVYLLAQTPARPTVLAAGGGEVPY